MKKILLLIFAFISINAFSQIKVKNNSFQKIEGYVMLDKKDHTDMNDAPMALIKIVTENINAEERRKFTFKGNAETYFDWTFEPGEIYLYVSAAAATFIEIIHEDYGKYEFKLPYDLCDYCGYDMVVEYLGTKENDAYLVVKSDQANAKIYIDGEEIGEQIVLKQFIIGTTHTWMIECDNYHTESGKVTITAGENVIEKKMRPVLIDVDMCDDIVGNKELDTDKVLTINEKMQTRDLYISSSSKSYYMFNPTKETLKEFNDNGVRFIMANASVSSSIMNLVDLPSDLRDPAKLSYGLSFGSYNSIGWYMSIMTSFNVTDSVVYTGATQFFPGFQAGVNDYDALTENVVNSRLSAMLGLMIRLGGPIYFKLGGGYGLYSKYYQTDSGDWYRSYESKEGWLVTGGFQFNMKHLILSIDVVSDQKFDMLEFKLGLGFGWKTK